MNRGRSSDSLDNGDDNIVCSSSSSSSPTDFTSDDETSTSNLFLISGQPLSSRSRATVKCNQPIKIDKYSMDPSRYRDDPTLRQSTNRPMILGPNDHHLPSESRCFSDLPVSDLRFVSSTSYYNGSAKPVNSSNSSAVPSFRFRDLAPDSSIALMTDQDSTRRCNNQVENSYSYKARNWRSTNRRPAHRAGHSSNAFDEENGENIGTFLVPEGEDDSGLFGQSDSRIESSASIIAGSSRGMNTLASRICSRLVECRNLIEAIEFVEQNRDLIDNLTRIVTTEAPAFRNYEITNYQVDYSVKESFNPNFWLDREPVVTTADGNCQYHAVSISLTGSEAYTPEVRLATAVAVLDNREWFDSMLKLIDRGTVLDLVHTIARSYSWGDETTLKAIAVAINRRVFLYTCNIGKKDYEMVKTLSKDELLDAFKEKKYRGGTGIHTYADPLIHVPANNYIMLFHKSEHFIAVLPTSPQLTMFEPYNPIVPVFN